MKNSLNPCLRYVLAFLLVLLFFGQSSAMRLHIEASDSMAQANRGWHKLTVKMHHFSKVVNAYVHVVTKIKPADTAITREVQYYSDTVDKSIHRTGPNDSIAVKKVENLFDSLVEASVRLVKKVETDSAFINNKAVKKLGYHMSNIREGINNYQKDLNESAARRKEKRAEPEPKAAP